MALDLSGALRTLLDVAGDVVLDMHRQSIDSGTAPDGSPQPGRGGADGVPLRATGRLRDATTATVEGETLTVAPPPDRREAVDRAHARGDRTIWHPSQLSAIEATIQQRWDAMEIEL